MIFFHFSTLSNQGFSVETSDCRATGRFGGGLLWLLLVGRAESAKMVGGKEVTWLLKDRGIGSM